MDISKMKPISEIYFPDTDYITYMENVKDIDICKYNPPSWLQHTETPFKWVQILDPKEIMRYEIDRKLEDYPEDDPHGCHSFEKVSLYILKIFQNVIMEDYDKARESLKTLKGFVEIMSLNEDDYIYNRIGDALQHVLLAITAQVAHLIGDITEEASQNIGLNLCPFSKMGRKVQAGIEAIKAKFYLSSSYSNTRAIRHMKEATKLDPECAAWLYWAGKITRKIRRSEKYENPNDEEIFYFESALELRRDPKYILYLAQGYCERAKYLYREDNVESNKYFEKSHELYKECWDLKKDSAAINRRLGNGVLSLKQPDYNLAECSLIEALSISNMPITYHILGSFYLKKRKRDCQEAVKYFTKGAEHGLMRCFNELIRIKYIFDEKYDPYEDLMKVEELLKYCLDLPTLYSDVIWYYLSIKEDVNKAVEYVFKIWEKRDPDYLKRFRSYTFLVNKCLNLYPILKIEVLKLLNDNAEISQDNSIFTKFLDKITENPDLVVSQDNIEYSLSSVKEDSKKSLNYWRNELNCNQNKYNMKPKENANEYQMKQFQEKHYRKANKLADNSGNSYGNRKIHLGKEQNERNPKYRSNGKNYSDKNYNWRTECKDK